MTPVPERGSFLQFTRLRLHGFKSFVESTELQIGPGLTGIVGPNGCGKSNLVEALQWVMGEASARRLRGGEMDDVIFGGTASRPGRSLASVTLSLDNPERRQPDGIEAANEMEIDRRIQRGKGSTYRINGKEARARDVQLLFADAGAGAQSVSLIGQGRIGWLINAKPTERRTLLEEAAGIGGLQTRRHEAELKLAAAEANLTRLADVERGLVQQIERLKKQAKQAERYRLLSTEIRRAEALLLHLNWREQSARVEAAEGLHVQAATAAASAEAAMIAAQARRAAAQAGVAPLRDAAAEAAQAAELQAATLHALDAEAARVAGSIAEADRRLQHLDQDAAREAALALDAAAALSRLAAEREALSQEQQRHGPVAAEAATALDAATALVAAAEAALSEATTAAAAGEAQRRAVEQRHAASAERRRRLERQASEAAGKLREIDLLVAPQTRLDAASAETEAAEAAAEAARTALETAERRVRETEDSHQPCRAALQQAERQQVTLKAEIAALRSVLAASPGRHFAPLLDQIVVEPGLEAALGAVLGDDLFAATDPAAPVHWVDLDADTYETTGLPAGATPFDRSVQAPTLLARRLAQTGLVPDEATGLRLQPLLAPGQRLVSPEGAVWRWDGLRQAAQARTPAALRLAQRARLTTLEADAAAASRTLADAVVAERHAAALAEQAKQDSRAARAAQAQAAALATQRRQAQQTLLQQHAQATARREAAPGQVRLLATELDEVTTQDAEIIRERQNLPELSASRHAVDLARAQVATRREDTAIRRRQLDLLTSEAAQRQRRLAAIATEDAAWRQRADAAEAQSAVLTDRRALLDRERLDLAELPARIAAEREATALALAAARQRVADARIALKEAEDASASAEREEGSALRAHAQAREALIRAESVQQQAEQALAALVGQIAEQFDCASGDLPGIAGFDPASDDTIAAVRARLDRKRGDREAIGPVNLMASAELVDLTAELTVIQTESADLVQAIQRLRQAIRELNREGRDRLVKAFDAVNAHFQALFVRLFGGGRAYLELSGGDGDPLAAGLEIMASPPGKKLQALSLLSGGERALTALALVFAVFLTNPAPVCVLDEVDAPLDDANVERFCSLVREIAHRAATRFLIVTHHRVTMARMDRLYGVTMVERGVSRLVSVELATAERLRQTA
jgi:chromosome segregation protein